MRRSLVAAVSALSLLVAGTLLTVGRAAPASASGCVDVMYVGAAGSGQLEKKKEPWRTHYLGPEVYFHYTRFAYDMRRWHPEHSYGYHPIRYPAEPVSVLLPSKYQLALVAAGNFATASPLYVRRVRTYFTGLSDGINDAVSYLQQQHQACPQQKFVLAGYSQGAMVMHRLLLRLQHQHLDGIAAHVAGTILIADGDRVPHSGLRIVGDPAAGDAGQGIAAAFGNQPNVPKRFRAGLFNLCTKNDLVCDFRGPLSLLHASADKQIHEQDYMRSRYNVAADTIVWDLTWPPPPAQPTTINYTSGPLGFTTWVDGITCPQATAGSIMVTFAEVTPYDDQPDVQRYDDFVSRGVPGSVEAFSDSDWDLWFHEHPDSTSFPIPSTYHWIAGCADSPDGYQVGTIVKSWTFDQTITADRRSAVVTPTDAQPGDTITISDGGGCGFGPGDMYLSLDSADGPSNPMYIPKTPVAANGRWGPVQFRVPTTAPPRPWYLTARCEMPEGTPYDETVYVP